MKFSETKLPGCTIVDVEPVSDARGFFARAWCSREFAEHGLHAELRQANLSYSPRRGTLRGLHWQAPPNSEAKLIRCTRGAVLDVAVDLRPDSPTYLRWVGVELAAESRRMLFVPEHFAHGFQTLEDDTEVHYLVSEAYAPEAERGARWDDPAFGIEWPLPVAAISDKDSGWPDFEP